MRAENRGGHFVDEIEVVDEMDLAEGAVNDRVTPPRKDMRQLAKGWASIKPSEGAPAPEADDKGSGPTTVSSWFSFKRSSSRK